MEAKTCEYNPKDPNVAACGDLFWILDAAVAGEYDCPSGNDTAVSVWISRDEGDPLLKVVRCQNVATVNASDLCRCVMDCIKASAPDGWTYDGVVWDLLLLPPSKNTSDVMVWPGEGDPDSGNENMPADGAFEGRIVWKRTVPGS